MSRFITFAVWVLGVYSACAQKFVAQQYSIREGLPQSEITGIAEDKFGYLWVGTASGGIVKFDGKEFQTFSTKDGLFSNFVNDLEIDSNGNIWVAHNFSISKFDGRHFKTFVAPDTIRQFGRIKDLVFDHDTLLIVSSAGRLGKIYSDSLYSWKNHCTYGKNLFTIQKSADGSLYFFFFDKTGVVKTKNAVRHFTLPFVMRNDQRFIVPKLILNYHNDVLAGFNDTIVRIDSTGATSGAPSGIAMSTLFHDPENGRSWARGKDSVFVFNAHGQPDDVCHIPKAKFLFKDKEGNHWIGTTEKGLFKVSTRRMSLIETTSGLKVNSILKVNDEWWFGTFGQGLYRLKNGITSRIFYDSRILRRNSINGMAIAPDHTVWVATDFGAGIFDPGGDTLKWLCDRNGFPSAQISNIQFDGQGRPWLSTSFMGTIVIAKSGVKILSKKTGGYSNGVYASYYSDFYKKMVLGFESYYQLADTATASTFPIDVIKHSPVVTLAPYQDSLVLIGTLGAGIVLHSPKTGLKANFTVANGFVSDFIYFIASDKDGNIWAGSEKGISKLRLNEKYDLVQQRFYETGETNQDGSWVEKEKLFGTIDGIYKFEEDDEVSKKDAYRFFPLHFTGIEHDTTNFNADDRSKKLELSYNKNSIAFRFNLVHKSDPANVKYSYILENFNDHWSRPTHQKEIAYSSLPPGDYIFRVKATDMISGYDENELSYPFSIRPPYYKTVPFMVLMIFTGILVVVSFVYLRIRANTNKLITIERIRSEQQAALRKEMAQDFHDEMGNQLARIINFTSQLQLKNIDTGFQLQLYKKIEDTAKNLYNGTREFIWSMNPENEKLHQVFNHIKDFAETLFSEREVRLLAENKSKTDFTLPFGYAREITLIFKEALTNVYKYSNATEVRLMLSSTQHGYEISITDNGIGFNLDEIVLGNGLSNMQNRANKIKAEFSIYSESGRGTSISLFMHTIIKPKYDDTFQKADSYHRG